MSSGTNRSNLHSRKALLERYRFEVISVSVPLTLTVVWLLGRPYYLAGILNSGVLFLLAETMGGLLIFSYLGSCLLLTFRLAVHLARRRLMLLFGPGISAFLIICGFIIFRASAQWPQFRFEYGFGQWVLARADLKATEKWRSGFELGQGEYAIRVPKRDWPSFVADLHPEKVSCERCGIEGVDLVMRWRGGMRRVYGLTLRAKEAGPYSPNWNGPLLEVAPGVYVWWY